MVKPESGSPAASMEKASLDIKIHSGIEILKFSILRLEIELFNHWVFWDWKDWTTKPANSVRMNPNP